MTALVTGLLTASALLLAWPAPAGLKDAGSGGSSRRRGAGTPLGRVFRWWRGRRSASPGGAGGAGGVAGTGGITGITGTGGVGGAGAAADASDVADLAERMAGLARAGIPERRTWEVLAEHGGSGAPVARVVAGVVGVGGRTGEGLRQAARELRGRRTRPWRPARGGPSVESAPAIALGWLALAADVVETSGAPSAAVYERITEAVRAEAAALDDQATATAGARSTATILSVLPAAGILLGALMGADVVRTLTGPGPGRICLVTGLLCWWGGRRWSARLIARGMRLPDPAVSR